MAFFKSGQHLAQLFTLPQKLHYQQAKFFDKRGYKAIEAFQNDIRENLREWSFDGKDALYYLTKDYWYLIALEKVSNTPILNITRFSLNSYERWDTWMNVNSCGVGRIWLKQEPQSSKRVNLFAKA